MSEETTIHILIDPEELADVEELAATAGIDLQVQPTPQALETLVVFAVTGGVLLVSQFLVDLFDRLRGGVVIDLRPSAQHLVRRDRDVPYGWALVCAIDGTVSIQTHDAPENAAERLLGRIIDGVLQGVQNIAEAARQSLGSSHVREQPPQGTEQPPPD